MNNCNRALVFFALFLPSYFFSSGEVSAQCEQFSLGKLQDFLPRPFSEFGAAVALCEDSLFVGKAALNSRSVARFERNRSNGKWLYVGELSSPQPDSPQSDNVEQFGASLAAHRGILAVGAPGSRSVYVFEKVSGGSWIQTVRLTPSDGQAAAGFGFSVAVCFSDSNGKQILVGAPFHNGQAEEGGAAYLFQKTGNTWVELSRLVPPDPSPGKRFGYASALREFRVLVGAPGDSEQMFQSGAAYLFLGTEPQVYSKIVPFDPAPQQNFGSSIALAQTKTWIGAPNDDDLGEGSGAAYVYDDLGSFNEKIRASGGAPGDQFGKAIAAAQKTVLIGAPGVNLESADLAGAAYIYRESLSWYEHAKHTAYDAAANDSFGSAVALDLEEPAFSAVGAPGDDGVGPQEGAVYLFDFRLAPEIIEQPNDLTVRLGETAKFSALSVVGGGGELGYQWYLNMFQLVRDDDRITGASTPTLTIRDVRGSDKGSYSLSVWGLCAAANSEAAQLRLRADCNCDGLVNNFDIEAFVLALVDPQIYTMQYPFCDLSTADVNGNGAVNSFDIDPFVEQLLGE